MKLLLWTAAIAVSGLMANASFAAALDSQTPGKNKLNAHVHGTMVNHPKPGSAVMFNPQPDPPGDKNGSNIMTVNHATPGSAVMFNPQPDPPGDKNGTGTTVNHATPGSNVMFNPQPDPPGDTPTATGASGGPG